MPEVRPARLLLLALLVACARIEAPPGGPPDEEGPQLLEMQPASGSLNQPLRPTFRFLFDEYVNRSQVASELRLSPEHPGDFELTWFGRRLKLSLSEALDPNRTYVLELGSGLSDLSGNPMERSLQLAFSTGSRIDSFEFKGRLSGLDEEARPLLWAWPLDSSSTPPFAGAPWQTRAAPSGDFRFSHLPETPFRVLAFDDRNGNRRWDYPDERAATGDHDPHPRIEGRSLGMRLAQVSLDSLNLLSVQAVDRRHLELQALLDFREDPGPAGLLRLFQLQDSLGRFAQLLEVREVEAGRYQLLCSLLDSLPYVLSAGGDTLSFRGSLDSLSAFQRWERDAGPDQRGDFRWQSGFAMERQAYGQAWLKSGADSLSIRPRFEDSWTLRWASPPQRPRADTLFIGEGLLRDLWGRSWPDSTLRFPLQAFRAPSLGSLELHSDRAANGPWMLAALKGDSLLQEQALSATMRFEGLPGGLLRLALYEDRDGDGRWSPGSLRPWAHAEPWLDLDLDSLEVLPGWTQDNIRLEIPPEVR